MSEQATEPLPFTMTIGDDGAMIRASLVPIGLPSSVPEELRKPLEVGSISRAACDSTGGRDGPLFKTWLSMMKMTVEVIVAAALGQEIARFDEVIAPGGLNG